MLIHFVHTGDAYLPELQAYSDFIQSCGHYARVHRQADTVPHDASVVWWMCGLVAIQARRCCPRAFHVHEYASASVGALCHVKDIYKRWVQPQPHYRIFQNDWVRSRMGFKDEIPFEYRDMGLTPHSDSHGARNCSLDFDFVYLGEMQRLRHFLPLFEGLAQSRRTVLLIGQMPETLQRYFDRLSNVTTVGKVPHREVLPHLKRTRYGLNLVPDQLPYTEQTSTKLLEYCAAGLNVVSTDYPWVRRFEQKHDASFSFIPFPHRAIAYSDLLGSALDLHAYRTPKLDDLAWPTLLKHMRIWQQLGIRS